MMWRFSQRKGVSLSHNQRGTVIVAVLLLFAIAAYLAAEITYRQKIDIRRTGTILAQDQAYEYLTGAEELAKLVLKDDLKGDLKKNEPIDTLIKKKDEWASKMETPVAGGSISGEVKDLQGRFNINWLLQTDPAGIGQQHQQRLVRLFSQQKIPKDGTAKELVDRIMDWLDPDDQPTLHDGLEDQGYLVKSIPYRTGNRVLVELSELLMVEGVTAEELEHMSQFLAVLPPNSLLNLNTALPEVLDVYECLDDVAKIKADQKTGITNLVDYTNKKTTQAGDPCHDVTLSSDLFSLNSFFFLLESEATINGRTIRMNSVIYRPEAQSPDKITVKVMYRKQLDPFSRV